MTEANNNAMMMIVSNAGVETPTKKRFSGLLKNMPSTNTSSEEKEKDMLLPLDVSLHSVNTEISNMTEITTITTVSQRDKEMDRAMAQLEYATTIIGGGNHEEQQHPVNALLHSFQHEGLGRPSMDTIPRPAPTLQDRLSFFARNVGLAAAATPPDASTAAGEPRRNGLAQFFQDRVDTFSRNMETIGSVWKRGQHQRAHWQPQQNTIQEEKKEEDEEDEEESQELQTPAVLLLEMEHPPTTSLDDVSSIGQRIRQSTQEQ